MQLESDDGEIERHYTGDSHSRSNLIRVHRQHQYAHYEHECEGEEQVASEYKEPKNCKTRLRHEIYCCRHCLASL